ncbi:YraN family protein [Oscillospiraceae bacterium PP1C4]
MVTTRMRGTLGEDFACEKLKEDGYEILVRNYRDSHSEIDIIAQKADTIAFVEVKTRSESALASPAQAVSKAQRRRIVLAAVTYLRSHGIYNTGEYQPRFDIFEVVTEQVNSPNVVRYFYMTAAYDTGDLHVFI